MSLRCIEGLADLGLWADAWQALADLPPEEKASPAALRMRLRCCPAVGAWVIGEAIARILRGGGTLDRNAAAIFYHAEARRLLDAGDRQAAAASIRAAIETWPDYLMAILLDPKLEAELLK
jgi:hypothetical protein